MGGPGGPNDAWLRYLITGDAARIRLLTFKEKGVKICSFRCKLFATFAKRIPKWTLARVSGSENGRPIPRSISTMKREQIESAYDVIVSVVFLKVTSGHRDLFIREIHAPNIL